MTEEDTTERLKERAMGAYKKYKVSMKVLSDERAKANEYYTGDKRGDEVDGRSKVISRDVYEVIESQMPALMKIFYGGQRVVEVSPQGVDDEDKASLMEEKINFDFQKQNKGFKILYQFFKDALLHRYGCVKYKWDTTPKWKFHEYSNITESYIRDLETGVFGNPHVIDEKIPVGNMGVDSMGMPVEATYNIKCREKIRQSRPLFTNMPLNELCFNIDMRDVDDEEGVIIHRIRVHKRKLKEYGFNDEELNDSIERFDDKTEIQSRLADLGGLNFITEDKKSDFVYLNECYLYDHDENGNPIPKIVHIVGDQVGKVEVNKYGRPPFCFISPTIVAHRLIGLSSENAVRDIQDIGTALLRNMLDNAYYQNSPVSVWNPFRLESVPDELIPGMKVIMKDDGDPRMTMFHIPPAPLAPQIPNLFTNVLPKIKGRRTGVTDFNTGLDPKSLVTRTSGGISQLMSSSQQPLELIARCFAETGVRDIFVACMQMNIDFLDIETNLKINKNWRTISREDINGLFDITIDVGVGTGSKDMIFNQIINMLNIYGGIAKSAGPMTTQIFTFENIREMLISAWELIGFKNAKGRFVANDPATNGGMATSGGAGAQIPGAQGQSGIQGAAGGSGQVYPQQMAAMPY